MPNIDISRHATDPRKHYSGVRMQQGRVLTDDDFNEAERIDAEDARRVRADIIGPAGSPDNGFQLFIDAGQVKMRAGTFYVGGLRVELENDEFFNLQRDWLQQGSAPNEALTTPQVERFDFVWLDVWQQPVTAVEDKELLEAALGGADTSARIRTMRRAKVLTNVGDVDCAAAWTQLQTFLAPLGTIDGDFELVPNSSLKIEPDGTAGTADLCTPPVNGGYLGAENQAIRVQITGTNQFTWGFDNGAPPYRVKLLPDNTGALRRIQMLTLPKDQAHYPLEGQVVELLPWSALLSNGQKNGELSGFLTKVSGGYNPDTQELFIVAAPGNDTGTPPRPFGERWKDRSDNANIPSVEDAPDGVYLYMRVWNRGGDTTSPANIPFIAGTPVQLARTGLQVTFTGTNLRKEDFWIIAARPETPDVVVPWELSRGRPPHGVRHWIAPLGVLHWPGPNAQPVVADDCRPTFLPLTKLKGCCTYTVGDGTHSFGNFSRIQNAINALPSSGGHVCVLKGIYNESVLVNQRVNVRVHGCGPDSRVQAVTDDGQPMPAFLVLTSNGITIEDLAIESGPRSAVQINNSRQVAVRRNLIQMRDLRTLWQAIFSRGDDILIDANTIEVLPREGGPPVPTIPPATGNGAPNTVNTAADLVLPGIATRGGIQLGGGSDRVRITNNIIRGGTWNGITLGSVHLVTSNDPDDDIPDRPDSDDPCDPSCEPGDTTEDDPTGGIRIVSAGDLYDIKIIGNRITDMGLNGISVVRFFNLANRGDMVGVNGLHIFDNFITRCMRREVAQVSSAMQFLVAYGGITLAKASDLRILRNEIFLNGRSHLDPIVGVFAIFAEGVQLDDNRIYDNGPRLGASNENAQTGIRGGVHFWVVLPISDPSTVFSSTTTFIGKRPSRDDLPTCSMRDNIIIAPLGRAVTFFALGQVVVARNRLVTQGSTRRGLDLIAATVLIGNFGLSNEWTFGLLLVMILGLVGKKQLTAAQFCQLAKVGGLVAPTSPPSLWPPLVRKWATGKTLFLENQVTLDLDNEQRGFGLTSITIFTLDDLGLTDNQCEITSTNFFNFIDAALFGGSLRVNDNRFSETWMRTGFSALTIGLMNTTTDNQSTHCILAQAILPGMRVFEDNLALVNAFCPNECRGGNG